MNKRIQHSNHSLYLASINIF